MKRSKKRGFKMKAYVLEKKGSIDDLKIEEITPPIPSKGEVRVKVKAVGLNPVDYQLLEEENPSWKYPFVLGLDVAGVIDMVGEDVSEWEIGQKVYYHGDLRQHGGYAEYAVTTAHTISKIPGNVDFEEAAAIPCAGFTAYLALYRKFHIRKGQTILIHGGAGGVGGFAVQLAKMSGLEVISTASRKNFSWVTKLGADHMIDYHEDDILKMVQSITNGRGVDFILNTVDSTTATRDLDLLAFNGQLAYIAGAPDFSKFSNFEKARSIHEISLGGAHLSGDHISQVDLAVIGKELIQLLSTGKLNSLLQETIPFKEIPKALKALKLRHVRGKIVAKID